MESIITWLQSAILKTVPVLDLSSLPGKRRGKLRLSPEQLPTIIYVQELAEQLPEVRGFTFGSHMQAANL